MRRRRRARQLLEWQVEELTALEMEAVRSRSALGALKSGSALEMEALRWRSALEMGALRSRSALEMVWSWAEALLQP